MATSTYDLVRQAIIEKKQIHATYGGHHREMCPHVIGTKNGRQQALFYQHGGSSSSGLGRPEQNWRCIPLDGLTNVTIHDGDWHSYSNHSQDQTCVDVIDVEVSY